jgi:hypothetical protein
VIPRPWIAVALAGATIAGADSALLDRSHDVLLESAFIPSPRNVHGELRLLRRGEATCAQTLLYTPALRRALQRIRAKEMRYWPEGRPGHEDSAAYLAALEQARARVLGGSAAGDEGSRLQTLAIEFVVAPTSALFAISELEIVPPHGGDPVVVRALRPIVVRESSPDYVREAIEHMRAAAGAEPVEDEGDAR